MYAQKYKIYLPDSELVFAMRNTDPKEIAARNTTSNTQATITTAQMIHVLLLFGLTAAGGTVTTVVGAVGANGAIGDVTSFGAVGAVTGAG